MNHRMLHALIRISCIPVLSVLACCTNESNKSFTGFDLSPGQVEWVDRTLAEMSMEEKLGQLLAPAIGTPGNDADSAPFIQVREWIEKYRIGHVYIADSRMEPVRTAAFINTIQEMDDIPLLIHSDLEAGPGSRVDGGTILPPLMGLGQTGSEDLVYEAAAITAEESRAIGIHLINSPVLDVNVNPDNPVINIRAFGDQPELVARLGKAYVRGLNDHNLIGAAKHFPGHGDVDVDSHSKMPTIGETRARFDSVELLPYREVIPSGLKAIMTAHISVPVIDPTPGLPATMSKPIITGLLRRELGFEGLIITDAFNMGGILGTGSFEEAAVRSFLAGNDIILLWTNPRFETVFPYFLKAIEEGRISMERLDESVRRVLNAKAGLGLHEERMVDITRLQKKVNPPEHLEKASEIYRSSLVLVRNEMEILPLSPSRDKLSVVIVNDDRHHPQIGNTLITGIRQRGTVTYSGAVDPDSSPDDLEKILENSAGSDVVVIGLFARIFARRDSPWVIHDQLKELIGDLTSSGKPVFLISFGSPYLLRQFPGSDGYMVATEPTWDFYGNDRHRPGQLAAAGALFGEIDIGGKLTVRIPGLYPAGHGIDLKSKER